MNKLLQSDQLARKRILDISSSFIVQAPAGSGKTECLTQRYLALLAKGVNAPEEIIAITFTRKATYEMQSRILAALQSASSPEPIQPHKAVTWNLAKQVMVKDVANHWHILSNPQRLRIMTIDALCAWLVKQMPMTSEFGGSLEIIEESMWLYEETADQILSQLIDQGMLYDELYCLLEHFDNDMSQLRNLLISMLKSRSHWQNYMLHQEASPEKLSVNRYSFVDYHVEQLDKFFSHRLPSLINILQQIDSDGSQDKAFWLPLLNTDDLFEKYILLAQFLLTKKSSWRKKFDKTIGIPSTSNNKPFIQAIKDWTADAQTPESFNLLQSILICPNYHYSESELTIIKKLLVLLPLASFELKKVFNKHQKVDFTEISLSALAALNHFDNPSDLAMRLDYQIKHLLIDEFQDTSVLQYHLLCRLTAEWESDDRAKSLFLVGDPMQSIYRFRDAEVGLFNYLQKYGLPNKKLESVNLRVNFRSSKRLVNWYNEICQKIFPKVNNPELGEIAYASSATYDKDSDDEAVKYYFHSNNVEVAKEITDICKRELAANSEAKIAILIRSRNHLPEIIRSLQQNNLEYVLPDSSFNSNPQIIHDLISFTIALTHPHDKIAWLTCLRAPYLGLTLKEITSILENLNEPISVCLKNSQHPRLKKFFEALDDLESVRKQTPIHYWLDDAWQRIGGYQVNRTEHYYRICRGFFNAVSSISKPITRKSLLEILPSLTVNQEPSNQNIHILTIHKSKGLEFDTVIIPHCEKETNSQQDSMLLKVMEWYHSELRQYLFLMAAADNYDSEKNSLYQYINLQEKQKNYAELKRLFYVAVTRAKKRLHLVSCVDSQSLEKFEPKTNSFLNYFFEDSQDSLINQNQSLTSRIAHYIHITNPIEWIFLFVFSVICSSKNIQLNISFYHFI